MQEPQTLVLEIVVEGATLKMSAASQGDFASTVRHYSRTQFSPSQIDTFCQEIIHILNRAAQGGEVKSEALRSLQKAGRLLWDYLITASVKEKLRGTDSRNLILSLDEELIHIPWELLYDGNEFICLKFNVGRIVRTGVQVRDSGYRSLSHRLKILVLANPTNDLKSAYSEGMFIRRYFDRRRKEAGIDFKSTHIDTLYVKKNIGDYDIVHFAGHCEYEAAHPQRNGWVLSDGRFTIQDILALSQSVSMPSLVFSNACYSAKEPNGLVDARSQEKTYSLASAFLFSGVRHYVGTMWKIGDPLSLIFAREFYGRLIRGEPIGACVRLARLALVKERGIAAVSWGSYILYGDPNFAFFRRQQSAKSGFLGKEFVASHRRPLAALSFAAALVVLALGFGRLLPTLRPDVPFKFSRASSLFRQGLNEEAAALCAAITSQEPGFLAAYRLLGDSCERLGKSDEALRAYFDYAFYSEKRNSFAHLAAAVISIGRLYQARGEYAKALDFYARALQLSREHKDKLNEAVALRRMAVWHIDRGDYDRALELLMKSSEINRERSHLYEHRYNLACDYFDIGLVFVNKDDFASSRQFYAKSKALFEKLKARDELSDYYFNLGEICLFEKQYQKALDSYMRGLSLDKAQGNKPSIAADYNMIGELYLEMGDFREAERYFGQAVDACTEIQAFPELAAAYCNLGSLCKMRNQKSRAREYLRLAQEIYYRIDPGRYQELKKELLSPDLSY